MSVRFAATEFLPYVCAVYVCRHCGHAATMHGHDVVAPPAGWAEVSVDAEPDHVCPGCAQRPES